MVGNNNQQFLLDHLAGEMTDIFIQSIQQMWMLDTLQDELERIIVLSPEFNLLDSGYKKALHDAGQSLFDSMVHTQLVWSVNFQGLWMPVNEVPGDTEKLPRTYIYKGTQFFFQDPIYIQG